MCYLCQEFSQTAQIVQGSGLQITGLTPDTNITTTTWNAINGPGKLPATGVQAIDGILIGVSYSRAIGQGATVRYDFTRPSDNSQMLSPQAQQVTTEWMQKWANIANINFVNVTSGDYEISYGMKNLSTGGGVKGYASLAYSGTALYSGPIVLDDDSPNLDSNHFMYTATGHEIGHALGLAHTFNSSRQSTVGPYKNQTDYSIMSYTGGTYATKRVADTPMWGDVMAIRHLYGKNVNYNSGDTTHTPTATNPYTIVDGAGNDTLLATNATGDTQIDLRFDWGETSDDRVNLIPVSGGRAVFWFADQFENAIGGNYTDRIIGNDAGNYLFGGAGNDSLNGVAGNDVLIGGNGHTDGSETGNDTLLGGTGNDMLFGNGGNDVLYGGDGVTASAGSGNDTLFGGAGNDVLYGNDGNDWLFRGPGQDSLYGGLGNDIYAIGWNDGGATIIYQFEGKGVNGGDILRVLANANNSGVQTAADVIAKMSTDGNHTWIADLNVLIAWSTPNQFGADDIQVVQSLT